jgi:lipopolysaccharide export system permease protein
VTRIGRYILAAFLKPLAAGTGALMVLVMLGDLFERLDKFFAGKASPRLVAEYLLALLPLRMTDILPVAALLAALLSLGELSNRKELIAAMGGGIHPWRCVRSLLWTGVLLSLFCLGLGEYVTPPAARRAKQIWNSDVRHITSRRTTRFEGVTVAGRGGLFYSASVLDLETGTLEDVTLDVTQAGRPLSQVQAPLAEWREDRWVFRDGVQRFYDGDGLILTAQKPFKTLEVKTKESPEKLAPPEEDTDALGYVALKRHVQNLKTLGVPTRKLEVEMYMKLALPWANFIVLLLGIPFAFQKTGGKVKAVGFALGVAFFYFGMMQVGRAVGQKTWCPAWLGAWMTNILFLVAGSGLFLRMRKLA